MVPRAPALASSEVASRYVEYNRGPLRAFLFTFAVILLGFALVAAVGWNQWAVAWVSVVGGMVFLVLGLRSYLAMSRNMRAELSAGQPPEDPRTHQPD